MSTPCGKHNERIFDLAGGLFDGCASAADIRQLETELGRAENRRSYLAYALLHAQLRLTDEALQRSFYVLEANRREVVNADETSQVQHGATKLKRVSAGGQRLANSGAIRRVAPATRVWLCALMIVVSVSLLGFLATRPRGEDVAGTASAAVSIGSFSRSANVRWAAGAHRWSVGDTLAQGQSVEFESGRVELQFDSGALMTVVGPASLEIQSANLVALHSGTATTRVENSNSREFRVVTPATEVLDLGTEFGVRVRPDGQTDVVVFEGKVDVTPVAPAADKTRSPQTLGVGEAVCVNGAGDWHRLVSIESDAFPFGDEMFRLSRGREPLIADVTDNRSTTERPKFYAIVPGGFREDARAFVDRVHEWNGLDRRGLPDELLGGDYVRTFNRDKIAANLEIVVTIARPANLYVLFDDRVPVPDWLSSGFVDLGRHVGMDLAIYPPSSVHHRGPVVPGSLGVGSGLSVDGMFSVWKREMRSAGEVRLGAICEIPNCNKPGYSGQSMYGIVATPLVAAGNE